MKRYRFLPEAAAEFDEQIVLYVDRPDEIIIVAIAPHRKRPRYWRGRMGTLR